MEHTFSRVKAIVADKLGVDDKDVIPQANFVKDLGADSLDVVELIMEFEKEFNVAILDEDAEKLHTIQEVVDFIDTMPKRNGPVGHG